MKEKILNKLNNPIYALFGVIVLLLAIAGSAYAYYQASISSNAISGTAAGPGELQLTVTDLSTSATGALIPMDTDLTILNKAALGYGNTSSNYDAAKQCIDKNGYTVCKVYQIDLKNKGTSPLIVTGGVTSLSGTNTPNLTCTLMNNNHNVSSITNCVGSNTLANKVTINAGVTNTYYVMVYINNLGTSQTDSGSFNGTIEFNTGSGGIKARFKSEAEETLTNLGLSVDTSHTPDFSTTSGNSGILYSNDTETPNQGDGTNGIYEAEDDLGTSYYFRGAVENNYVRFGGTLWRIVRINGDGTIRIALNQSIGTGAYNCNYNDNAYVGYMYGTAGSSTYAGTHANTNDSNIKKGLDAWYQANLSQYDSYIADAIYCNDRSVTHASSSAFNLNLNGTGKGTEETAYSSLTRNFINFTPSLICLNNNDKFTKSNTIGNGALTYPIGLLTTDELLMAGAGPSNFNDGSYFYYNSQTGAFYLYDNNNWYWTMTSDSFVGGGAGVDCVSFDGYMDYNDVYFINAVRPAVSLKSDVITGGTGTSSDPFVVGGTNDSTISLTGNFSCS